MIPILGPLGSPGSSLEESQEASCAFSKTALCFPRASVTGEQALGGLTSGNTKPSALLHVFSAGDTPSESQLWESHQIPRAGASCLPRFSSSILHYTSSQPSHCPVVRGGCLFSQSPCSCRCWCLAIPMEDRESPARLNLQRVYEQSRRGAPTQDGAAQPGAAPPGPATTTKGRPRLLLMGQRR